MRGATPASIQRKIEDSEWTLDLGDAESTRSLRSELVPLAEKAPDPAGSYATCRAPGDLQLHASPLRGAGGEHRRRARRRASGVDRRPPRSGTAVLDRLGAKWDVGDAAEDSGSGRGQAPPLRPEEDGPPLSCGGKWTASCATTEATCGSPWCSFRPSTHPSSAGRRRLSRGTPCRCRRSCSPRTGGETLDARGAA